MESSVHLLSGRTSAGFQEALLEVIRQECVQNRIHGGVGVGERSSNEEYDYSDGALALSRWCEDERNLRDPIRKPAEDIHGDHRQDKLGHFPMWLLLLFWFILRTHSPQFPYNKVVEDEYENERDGKAQDERIKNEGALSVQVLCLWPHDVAALCILAVNDGSIHDDWNHEDSTGGPRNEADNFANEWRP